MAVMGNAYYARNLFDQAEGTAPGVIFLSEKQDFLLIASVGNSTSDAVMLDGADVIGLLKVALPILSAEQMAEVREIIYPAGGDKN